MSTQYDMEAPGRHPHIDPATVVHGRFGAHDHPVLGYDATPEWLGYTVSAYGPGYARAHMVVRGDMLNGFGIAHGGVLFAFADTCFAWATNHQGDEATTISVSSGATIEYLSSPSEGARISAAGIVKASSGRSAVCDVTVTDQEGKILAEYRGRARRIPRR